MHDCRLPEGLPAPVPSSAVTQFAVPVEGEPPALLLCRLANQFACLDLALALKLDVYFVDVMFQFPIFCIIFRFFCGHECLYVVSSCHSDACPPSDQPSRPLGRRPWL